MLQDGVGFYRKGEAFVFQICDGRLDIDRLAYCINRVVDIQRELWNIPVNVHAGVHISRATSINFYAYNTPIASINPSHNLSSCEYRLEESVPVQIFIDLLEAGGLNALESTEAAGKVIREIAAVEEAAAEAQKKATSELTVSRLMLANAASLERDADYWHAVAQETPDPKLARRSLKRSVELRQYAFRLLSGVHARSSPELPGVPARHG
jgi:hypothetical protein